MRSLGGAYRMAPIEDCKQHPADDVVAELVARDTASRELIRSMVLNTTATWRADLMKSVGRTAANVSGEWGIGLVMAALRDTNAGVRDAALQALENWRTSDALKVLKLHAPVEAVPMLQRYATQLIKEIEDELR